jgi:hypothetical protein
MPENTGEKTAPLCVIDSDSGTVHLKIWDNQFGDQLYYRIQFSRSFKNPETGEWGRTQSFNPQDLSGLEQVIKKAKEVFRELGQDLGEEVRVTWRKQHDKLVDHEHGPEPEQERGL